MKLLCKWFVCFGALVLTAYAFAEHVTVNGGLWALAAGAIVLWLLNLIVRPLLQLVCLPATLLTFGLFYFVANAWMVGLMDAMLPFLHLGGFWVRLFAAVVVSLGNAAIMTARRARS